MKIAVIGTGALGGYYAACLARGGSDVHCLLRSGHEAVEREGLRVKSVKGDFTARVRAHRKPSTIGVCDLAIVAVKTTANSSIPPLLKPVVGPKTMVLTLQNGLGNEDFLARFHKPDQIMGGVAFLCSNRIAPGHIHHLGHGHIQLAELSGAVRERTRAVAKAFEKGGVECKPHESLGEIRWRKSVWNIPFNGLSVAANRATVEDILDDPELYEVALKLMRETLAAARAEGHKIPDSFIKQNVDYSRTMGPYKSSMQLDFEAGRPLEHEAIVGEPLRRARKRKLGVPAMQELYAALRRWSARG